MPAELRERDRIRAGQQFAIERLEDGAYLLRRLAVPEKAGLTDWLLTCPEKGWYRPLPSESTDVLSADLL